MTFLFGVFGCWFSGNIFIAQLWVPCCLALCYELQTNCYSKAEEQKAFPVSVTAFVIGITAFGSKKMYYQNRLVYHLLLFSL